MSSPPAKPSPRGSSRSPMRAGPSHSPRSGAHRPRRPLWHDVLPAVVVLVAVAALVFGVVQLKDSVLGGTSTGSNQPGPGPDDANTAPPTAPVTTSGTGRPSASATPSGTSPSRTVAPVNRAARVTVLNSTPRAGLAKGAASLLRAAGWRAVSGGNQHGYGGPTTVFYTRPALLATAAAVAKDLGGYPVVHSSAYGSVGVVVVLGSDYRR